MKPVDAPYHVRGDSRFIDDLPLPPGLHYGAIVSSACAHGVIENIAIDEALSQPDVAAVLTAKDIPGINQIGNIIEDEPLLADHAVHYIGQPVAFVAAKSAKTAQQAASMVQIDYSSLPANFDPRKAAEQGHLIAPQRVMETGDVIQAFEQSDMVVQGRARTGAQEHLYLETQSALAIPKERCAVRLLSATQSPSVVQRTCAQVLGVSMNKIQVETQRLGGAFGGKEDQATPIAVLTALAATRINAPVKTVLPRDTDMRITGKRHPYEFDYKLGLTSDGRILAYDATYYQNSGAAADLSTAIMERSLLHCTGAYRIPNVRITGLCCRTNLPPFTAFRGFGAPQAIFCIEAAIDHAARALEIPRWKIQSKNLLKSKDRLPFGMAVENAHGRRSFEEISNAYDFRGQDARVKQFNQTHRFLKQGLSVQPICFGISFTNTVLNQAGALLHIYTDGSVSLNTGAVEMGQGVNSKLITVVASTLGIPSDRITVKHTNTDNVANTSPTAASSGADLNGMAATLACRAIKQRLLETAAKKLNVKTDELELIDAKATTPTGDSSICWNELVQSAYLERVNLTAQAHYATPNIYYDKQLEQGRPFAYHVFGTALTTVTLDVLRGTFQVDRVSIVHDAGRSLNRLIDTGQVEGGLLQGIGWMTGEEIIYRDGELLTGTLSTYKVPDLPTTPNIDLQFMSNVDNPEAVMQSKAIGEPPFLYGIGTFFALLDAVRAHRPAFSDYTAPLTNERLLLALSNGEIH